jgi:hypothetical protein
MDRRKKCMKKEMMTETYEGNRDEEKGKADTELN